jgi:hypothetical protein
MEGKNWSILFKNKTVNENYSNFLFRETLISRTRFRLFVINKSIHVADVWVIRVGSHTTFSKLRHVRMSSYSNFLFILNETCDKHIPAKTVIIRPNDKPFMNSSIRKAIRKRKFTN